MGTHRDSLFEVVLRGYGGTVALMLELMLRLSSLPDHATVSSNRSAKSVRVVRYGRALRAIKELLAKSG